MSNYKKTQYGFLISTISILSIIAIVLLYMYPLGNNPMPVSILIILLITFIFAFLFFYKLTISIDDTRITASLGIGLLKRSMLIDHIDFETLEKITPTLITGIGIRHTTKGWLWNVKVGDAIYFKNKAKSKNFLVGTDEFETITNILNQK